MIEYKKLKTKKQKEAESGLMIKYIEVEISIFKMSGKRKAFERSFSDEIIYKAIYPDINQDNFVVNKLRNKHNIKDKELVVIKIIKDLKELGYGVYEEQK